MASLHAESSFFGSSTASNAVTDALLGPAPDSSFHSTQYGTPCTQHLDAHVLGGSRLRDAARLAAPDARPGSEASLSHTR